MSAGDAVDVLVVGFGAAGAAAAIAAHDAGASVAIVEKATAPGGNCRYSGGFLFDIAGPNAVAHLDAVCFAKTDRPVLEAYVTGLGLLPEWLARLGGETALVDLDAFNGMLPCWPHFPAGGEVQYRHFVAAPGSRPGAALWQLLEDAVHARGIPVTLASPAVELLRTGARVSGARLADGSTRGARRAVILTSGGFEADPVLRDTYLPLPLLAVGHQANTGDTLALVAPFGAQLWHMSAFFGWLAFAHPDFAAAFTLDVHAPSFIYIDGDGRRFADETGWEAHDRVRMLSTYLPRRANRPRMPGWIIFDEAARRAGPLHGIVGSPNAYSWSADNSAEIAAGWIVAAANAGDLAAAAGIDPTILAATLDGYHEAVRTGSDDVFGRQPGTLVALEPPLYAIPFHPAVATASGGPRRDRHARVLDGRGLPIPGLYGAGAAGSIWGHLTEHGGGLTDALVFGAIAGHHGATNEQE